MTHFTESNDLLNDPPLLRKRLSDDGYLFLRDILPKEDVLSLRRRILEFCREAGWLRAGSNLMDGLTDHAPLLEGEPEWRPVYAKVQALEAFHRLKLHDNVRKIMEDLFQEPVFALPMTIARVAFPRDNERSTQPHQDWLYVGGSTEIISCWAPLGDIPQAVGGLKILRGSHKAGFLAPQPAPGPGGNTVDVDPTLEWLQADYRTGDVLLFKALTVHAAAENHTPDVLRLSIDFRYAGESHTITEPWLKPHFHWLGEPFTWDVLDKEWRNSPTARYWERLPNLKTKPHERFGRK
jgi:hypothetical protein